MKLLKCWQKLLFLNHCMSVLTTLFVFYVPSTARSIFKDGTPIYCPLRRTRSSVNTPFQPGIEPRVVAWRSITLPLRHASSLWPLCIRSNSELLFTSEACVLAPAWYTCSPEEWQTLPSAWRWGGMRWRWTLPPSWRHHTRASCPPEWSASVWSSVEQKRHPYLGFLNYNNIQ